MNLWISPAIFDWTAYSEGGKLVSQEIRAQAYRHLAHAEKRLDASGADERVDAICALKRAVNRRLKDVGDLYLLGSHPLKRRKESVVDFLTGQKVIRQSMLKHLIKIRNDIEHLDAHPPSQRACGELVDFVWYFLRSTDPLVKAIQSRFIISPLGPSYDNQVWLEIATGPKHAWTVDIRGWLSRDLIDATARDGWFELVCETRSRDEVISGLRRVVDSAGNEEPLSDDSRDALNYVFAIKHSFRPPDAICVLGRVVSIERFLTRASPIYFATAAE